MGRRVCFFFRKIVGRGRLKRRDAGCFGDASLGRTEPHLDEPDRRDGSEISLVHWRPRSVRGLAPLEGGHLANARRPLGRQHVKPERKRSFVAKFLVAVAPK